MPDVSWTARKMGAANCPWWPGGHCEEVWGKYLGFPGIAGEKVELVHGVSFKYNSESAKVVSLVWVPGFSPKK